MAPPELARDAPVVDVGHPLEVDLLVVLGREADGLVAVGIWLDGGDGELGHGCAAVVRLFVDGDEPLRGEARLDDGFAAVAMADVVGVVLDRGEEPLLFEVVDDFLARHIAVEARVGAAFGVDVGAVVHHVDGGQMVALAEGEVVGIVRGRDLDGAGAEVAADPGVDNDGNLAIHERQAQLFAVEMEVALVLGMNGHGGVAEHGLGARRGNGNELAGLFAAVAEDGVANLPEMAFLLLVDDFEIADGGLAARAPVDDVRAAVDEALMVEADEGFAHGEGAGLVHGEVLAAPVDGDAEALHLLEDGSAVVTPPLPYALDEGLAAQLLARAAFLGQLALDHHLRGDAGVVGAGNPEGAAAAHAAPAGEDVHLRLVEHVAHVQAARDVGRRQQDGERRTGRPGSGFGLARRESGVGWTKRFSRTQ